MIIKVLIILVIIYLIYTVVPTYYYKFKNVSKRKNKEKIIYLTFDDGPSRFTPLLLDTLNKYKVKASFFCITKNGVVNKDIIKRMKDENHLICMHSEKHTSAYLMDPITTNKDFKNSIEDMYLLKQKPIYYRPPWGILNISSLINIKKYNLKLVLWDIMVGDWKKNITIEKIENKLLKRITGSAIICLHDGRGKNNAPLKTINALEKVIPALIKKGYKFETVDKYEE